MEIECGELRTELHFAADTSARDFQARQIRHCHRASYSMLINRSINQIL